MNRRHAVITVLDPDDNILYELFYKQPFNNFGVEFSFTFGLTVFNPFADCDVVVQNPGIEFIQAISFDPQTYFNRPKIEIRSGNTTETAPATVKNSIPLIYTGYPFYYSHGKYAGTDDVILKLSNISGETRINNYTGVFNKGTTLKSVFDTLLSEIDKTGNYDNIQDRINSTLEVNLYYTHRNILTDILPEICKTYKLSFNMENDSIVFYALDLEIDTEAETNVITEKNGMIGYPQSANFTQWNFKTFFATPRLYYPGETVRITSPYWVKSGISGDLQGMIVEGKYNWMGIKADCQYLMTHNGEFINYAPTIQI